MTAKVEAQCSFCGQPQNSVKRLIQGPNVQICNECIDICNEIIADDQQVENLATNHHTETISASTLQCSFCAKHQDAATHILPVPNVYVCNECLKHVINRSQ
jgi:ATP-dependent protease Clp ATPase subunit